MGGAHPGMAGDAGEPRLNHPRDVARVMVVDSGIGGLSIVNSLLDAPLALQVHYIMDDEFFPYGHRPVATIRARSLRLVQHFVAVHAPDVVVIACNTISTLALDQLRAAVRCPIIGVVPALKVAGQLSRTRTVGIIATEATVYSDYVERLRMEFAPDLSLVKIPAPGLVRYADRYARGERNSFAELQRHLTWLDDHDLVGRMDQLVLGCTHFSAIKHLIRRYLPVAINIVDNVDAIHSRLCWWLGHLGFELASGPAVGQHQLTLYSTQASQPALTWSGQASPGWGRVECRIAQMPPAGRPAQAAEQEGFDSVQDARISANVSDTPAE